MKAMCWIMEATDRVAIQIGDQIFISCDPHDKSLSTAEKIVDDWNHKLRQDNFPATEQAAIEAASMLCIPDDFVKMVYLQCEGRGWVDGADIPIKNFRSHVNYRWHRERGSFEKEKKEGVWATTQRLSEVDRQIKEISDPESLGAFKYRAVDGKLLPVYKERLTILRDRRKQLANELVGA